MRFVILLALLATVAMAGCDSGSTTNVYSGGGSATVTPSTTTQNNGG